MSALRGNLADFGIAEVFQLIGQQRKTGYLEISSASEKVRLAFDGGAVVRAEPLGDRDDAGLAELLVRCGMVTREALAEAQRDSDTMKRRLVDVLAERGAVTREALHQAEDLLTQETLFRLLRWSDGSFSFSAASVPHDRAGRLLAAEQILMDGLRMIDEWKTFADQVPSDEIVFQRIGRFEDFASRREGQTRRLEMGRRVFQLVDGRLPVRRVVDLSRLGTFEATRMLAELRRAGMIEPLDPAQVARRTPRAELRHAPTRPLIAGALPLVLLAALATLSGSTVTPRGGNAFAIPRHAWEEARGAWETERVRRALEAFRFSRGQWPDDLEELVRVGLLEPSALTPSTGRPYHYSRFGRHAVLLAPEE